MADNINAVELAIELTVAWLSNPSTRASTDDVPAFLNRMCQAIGELASPASHTSGDASPNEYTPAVSVRKSLASKDHIISLIDGKPYKTLKRHLSTNGLTPDQYRARYKLKSDYPMVAENYGQARREMAKRIGLGRKPNAAADAESAPAAEAEAPAPKRRRKAPPAE